MQSPGKCTRSRTLGTPVMVCLFENCVLSNNHMCIVLTGMSYCVRRKVTLILDTWIQLVLYDFFYSITVGTAVVAIVTNIRLIRRYVARRSVHVSLVSFRVQAFISESFVFGSWVPIGGYLFSTQRNPWLANVIIVFGNFAVELSTTLLGHLDINSNTIVV